MQWNYLKKISSFFHLKTFYYYLTCDQNDKIQCVFLEKLCLICMCFHCLLLRIFVATKESWIDTDYYHSDQFHPMQMTYHPPGIPQSEHHGQIHDDERNHKVYIPNENELRPNSIPNRRKLFRKSQNFRGNTYFRQISRR